MLSGIAYRMRFQFTVRTLSIVSVLVALGLQIAFQWKLSWAIVGLPINVWVGIEPRNYLATRATQIPIETYLESVDRYYEPFEILFEEELAKISLSVHAFD